MTDARNSIRLLVEILVIVALVQAAVMLALPAVAGSLPAATQVVAGYGTAGPAGRSHTVLALRSPFTVAVTRRCIRSMESISWRGTPA